MSFELVATSILLGSLIGLIYGLFFLTEKRRAFFTSTHPSILASSKIKRILFACARIFLFASILVYVLRSLQIQFILVLIFFFITFWLVIFIDSFKKF
jgi:hypothetical protein